MLRTILPLGLIACAAAPAAAEDLFQRPEVCVLFATAQYDDCTVTNMFDCPALGLERSETWRRDGLHEVSQGSVSDQQHFTQAAATTGSIRFQAVGDTLDDVVASGTGNGGGVGEYQVYGMWLPVTIHFAGRHEGETRRIGDVSFEVIQTRQDFQFPYPAEVIVQDFTILYDPVTKISILERRAPVSGMPGNPPTTRLTRLSLQGQAGYGAEVPVDGCPAISGLDLPVQEIPS